MAAPHDRLSRPLRDLRISVTDRCNLRCRYCMPREAFGRDHAFLPSEQLLSFEEIARLAGLFCELGVRRVRLTGGEPLVRRDLERLVALLAALPGLEDLALTTNGTLLARHAHTLARAGLRRVTVSLDSLEEDVFQTIADTRAPLGRVLAGIDAAAEAGLDPIKINMVVRRGLNERSVLAMAERFRHSGKTLRFIEYMDVGTSNGWRPADVVPGAEIRRAIEARWALQPLAPRHPGEVATRYRYTDGGGELGFVQSVSSPFCASCTRARLSAEGRLYTCLFATAGHDLRAALRGGADDEQLRELIAGVWSARADRYSAERQWMAVQPAPPSPSRVEMSYIGG
jgi:cyclic pyranopterin phosphate synthase